MNIDQFKYNISEISQYINWSYFYHAWGLHGEKQRDSAGKELLHDAVEILNNLEGKIYTHALFRLADATSQEDNIIIDGIHFPLLRQQHNTKGKANLCLSDFISPHKDKIGLFATTIDKEFEDYFTDDPYNHMLIQTLAARLVEATADLLHKHVRTTLWGYAREEELTIEELHKEQYSGIRPAIGYPSLPDQSVIFILDNLLQMSKIGISLTQSGAMIPRSSVCGLMISHTASQYFSIGKITEEQLIDYAKRREFPLDTVRKFLAQNL